MKTTDYTETPFKLQISFHKVIESLEEIALTDVDYRANYAKALLKEIEPFPELRDGIASLTQIEEHSVLIKYLLADLFPTALSNNEIKAVSIPFQDITFNYSGRFTRIMDQAGPDFDISIRNFDEHQFYVFSCCMILNSYYGQHFDFAKPLFYDIPDADGIIKHYRILYNADFIEVIPTEKAVPITPEDILLLADSFDNLELWKEKFPNESWILKGFGIMTLFDATTESSISNLKSTLLSLEEKSEINQENLTSIFRSIYRMSDLEIGFTAFNAVEAKFVSIPFEKGIKSHILADDNTDCDSFLCDCSYDTLVSEQKYFIISDVEAYADEHPEEARFTTHLLSQNIRSCIFAPLVKNERILGVIELVSAQPRELNSINANKLDFVLPFLVDTIDRHYSDLQNQIDAIIQKEYTAIHPSVYWKFRDEALLHVADRTNSLTFKEIVFKEVIPLYGQIDIKGSSTARNEAIQKDLTTQLSLLQTLFGYIGKNMDLPVVQQNVFELRQLEKQLQLNLKADTESQIQNYIVDEIHPILEHFKSNGGNVNALILQYFEALDPKINMIYAARKDFDKTLSVINKKMAYILDQKQEMAQTYFPHYYERFKTDGVEHNLYIGASIAPQQPYNTIYLSNLRLWQLQAMCELENEYFRLRPSLPYDLDVTSLILVFSSAISIRFRMDEKRFDVDGTYNARYEVVKKRIDKANVKGTNQRITEKGKITIVYSQNHEETEYRRYIEFLQHKNILGIDVEKLEVEDLQGVTGLRALRISVLYQEEIEKLSYTYQDLLEELN